MRHRCRAEARSGEACGEWVSGEDRLSEDWCPRSDLPPSRLVRHAATGQAHRVLHGRRCHCVIPCGWDPECAEPCLAPRNWRQTAAGGGGRAD